MGGEGCYWRHRFQVHADRLRRHPGTDVASGFLSSPEAQKLYGNLDPTNFLTQLYANVLDRKPDADGLAWHLNNLNHGVSMAQTLVDFSESAENVAKLVGVMTNGVDYVPSA